MPVLLSKAICSPINHGIFYPEALYWLGYLTYRTIKETTLSKQVWNELINGSPAAALLYGSVTIRWDHRYTTQFTIFYSIYVVSGSNCYTSINIKMTLTFSIRARDNLTSILDNNGVIIAYLSPINKYCIWTTAWMCDTPKKYFFLRTDNKYTDKRR